MELIKQMTERRKEMGITSEKPKKDEKPASVAVSLSAKAPKSLKERRQDIIESKPKIKVIKEYFEDIINHAVESDSDED